MDVHECITAYESLMKTVFKQKKNYLSIGLTGNIKARFSSKALEEAIKSVIEARGFPVDEPFYKKVDDEQLRRCKVYGTDSFHYPIPRLICLGSFASTQKKPGTRAVCEHIVSMVDHQMWPRFGKPLSPPQQHQRFLILSKFVGELTLTVRWEQITLHSKWRTKHRIFGVRFLANWSHW